MTESFNDKPAQNLAFLEGFVLKKLMQDLFGGKYLSETETMALFGMMLTGCLDEAQIAAVLTAFTVRGETIPELTGAARVMQDCMIPLPVPLGTMDCCGTGGDSKGTVNISTAVSFIIAGTGIPVAKHGNRSVSSKSGAADVLDYLGAESNLSPEDASRCLEKANVTFLMAPRYHPHLKYVSSVRKSLGVRTIFNLLGPLCNPARVQHQLIGVYAPELTETFAHVLKSLGTKRACIVHGADGLDEFSLTGSNRVTWLWETGEITTLTVTPEDMGFTRCTLSDLIGGEPDYNAFLLREMLKGTKGAYRDCVLMNAAAALVVSGKVSHLRAGVVHAARSIDTGAALKALDTFIEESQTVELE